MYVELRNRKIQVTCSGLNRKLLAAQRTQNGFPKAQMNATTTGPSVCCFCRSCPHVATTGTSSVEEAELTWSWPLNWQKWRLMLSEIWAKMSYSRNSHRRRTGFGSIRNQFEKNTQCPNTVTRKLFRVCTRLFISMKYYDFSLFNVSSLAVS